MKLFSPKHGAFEPCWARHAGGEVERSFQDTQKASTGNREIPLEGRSRGVIGEELLEAAQREGQKQAKRAEAEWP